MKGIKSFSIFILVFLLFLLGKEAYSAPFAVVANEFDRTINTIDLGTGPPTVFGPFLGGQLGGSGLLQDVATTPDGNFALLGNSELQTVFLIDVSDPTNPTLAGSNVPPLRIISGENTGLSRPLGIFVDTENDEIFVTNPFDNTITIYGRTDEGNDHPKRTIAGFNTRLFRPAGIFLDTENDEIFVANADGNRITVYRRTDEGNVFPKRTIVGPNTGLALPWGIFVADSP